MLRYVGLRLLGVVATVWAACTVIFLLARLLPSDDGLALDLYPHSPAADARFASAPALTQYVTLIGSFVRGDFGFGLPYRPNSLIFIGAARVTTVLVLETTVVTTLVAVPLGFLLASHRRRIPDRVLTVLTIVGASFPLIMLAPFLEEIMVFRLHLLPPIGPSGTSVSHLVGDVHAMVLPVATLAVPLIGRFALIIRSSALEQQQADYVRTARAKGIGGTRLVVRHQLRNVAATIFTYAGATVPLSLSGVIIVEGYYNLNGLGFQLQQAAGVGTDGGTTNLPDVGLVLVDLVFITTLAALAIFVFDVLVVIVDPRRTR